MKIRQVGAGLFRVDGRTDGQTDRQTERRTDMAKLIVFFHKFAHAPKMACKNIPLLTAVRQHTSPVTTTRHISTYTKTFGMHERARMCRPMAWWLGPEEGSMGSNNGKKHLWNLIKWMEEFLMENVSRISVTISPKRSDLSLNFCHH